MKEQMNYFGQADHLAEPPTYSPFSEYSDNKESAKVVDLYGAARNSFISKVYTILTIQLLVTVLITAISMTNEGFMKFQIEHVALFWVALIMTVIIQIYLFCCSGGRKFPQNIICTSIFTICQAYIVSFICSITGKTHGNSIVFIAAFLTLAVVAACTAYACLTKEDFTTSYAIFIVIFVVMVVVMIIMFFVESKFLHLLYCGLGVILFGIYIVIDTQMIMGGKTIQLEIDEYYIGALILYIDVVAMFLYILQILGILRSQ